MFKKTLLIALGALLAQGALADVLTPEAALQRAAKSDSRRAKAISAQPSLAATTRTAAGTPAVYVFNQAGGGSLIVSASDVALPILGYTDAGAFDPANVPPQLQEMLEAYAAQIEYAEEHSAEIKDFDVRYTYPTSWEYIAPLVQTKWDQGNPYNNLVPSKYATGCVATAMAQIMNYHKFPEIGHGSNSYVDMYGQRYSMSFDEQSFDWANMLDDYSTTKANAQQINAVAYLMKACGFSTNMTYGPSSGTQTEDAAIALIKYFDYNPNITFPQRANYTLAEWAELLYNQLKNVGPVLYSGHALDPAAAHAYIADGYDGNGYFHINWGWSGMCDGFYSLDALNPLVQGTGGTDYGGFNFTQGMVIDIYPSDGTGQFEPKAELQLNGNITADAISNQLTLSISRYNPGSLMNNSLVAIYPVFGMCFENASTGEKTYMEATARFDGRPVLINQEDGHYLNPGSYLYGLMTETLEVGSDLPNAKYKVYPVWKDMYNTSIPWTDYLTQSGCSTFAYVTKTSDKSLTVENLPAKRLKIESAKVVTPLYMRSPCEIEFKVSNPSDELLTQSIVPVLLNDGALCFEGDSQLITVGPNETITKTMVYTFSNNGISGAKLPTTSKPMTYTLGAYDYIAFDPKYYLSGYYGDEYYGNFGTVEMKRSASNPTIELKSISIDNYVEDMTIGGVNNIYGIDEFSNIALTVSVLGTHGFVSSPLTVVVHTYDPATGTTGDLVYEKNFEDLIYVEDGQEDSSTTHLNFRDFDPNEVYQATVYYVIQKFRQELPGAKVLFSASSGVNEVAVGEALSVNFDGWNLAVAAEAGVKAVNVYDLSGQVVAAPVCGGKTALDLNLGALPKGIYLVKATDANGNARTLKICK